MTEEVIIDLKLEKDEGDFAKLAQFKSSIINLKQEQDNLRRAYKAGQITLKEFSSETVRVEALIKKQSDSYNKLQRSVTGLKSPFDKLNESIKAQAQQVQVAGVSLATFANPVTATIGVLGGLFKAYSSTTIGAKDLEFASNQLSAAMTLVGNSIAGVISSAEDGEGFFSKTTNFLLSSFSPALASVSRALALAKEGAEDLQREGVKVSAQNKIRLAENADFLEKLADSQVSIEEKMRLVSKSITNITINRDESLRVAEEELEILNRQLATDKDNEKILDAIGLKELEIQTIRTDAVRQIARIEKMESNILDTEIKKTEQLEKQNQKRAEAERKALEKTEKSVQKGITEDIQAQIGTLDDSWEQKQKQKRENDLKEMKGYQKEREKLADKADKDEADRKQKMADYTVMLYANQVDVYAQMLQQSNNIGLALLKGFLINMLRMLKSALQAKIIGESFATADSILSFGATGVLRSAVLVGLLEGAFAVAENFISGFAQGGKVEGGTPISRKNGDNRLITAKVGEVVLTEGQQQALGGPATFARIGVPGFRSPNTGQSEFAIGGRIPMPDDSTRKMMEAFQRLQVAVVIEQVELKMQQRAEIREMATL